MCRQSKSLAFYCTHAGMLHTPTPTPDNTSHLLRGPKEPPRTANGEATQKIIVAARQANELLMRQAKIDAEVKER